MRIKAGIIGATGYAGAEICRLLTAHPEAEITAISSVSFEGKKLSEVYPSYLNICDMICETQSDAIDRSDVVFAALPHGLSQAIAEECNNKGKVFIDLGADFRLRDEQIYSKWYDGIFDNHDLHERAVYGLPEIYREKIKGKKVIANPGCYTTAVPLALMPAIREKFIHSDGIIADCKSGVTGAGRGLSQNTHFAELNEGFSAYKVASHRHTPEIEQTISDLFGKKTKLTFTPHLLPVNRGILATCYARLVDGVTEMQVRSAYESCYKDEFFVRLMPEGRAADIKNVRYTNYCDVSVFVDEHTGMMVAISAIDNMVKGAAGQAVQNMNIAFGIDERAGLMLIPPAF